MGIIDITLSDEELQEDTVIIEEDNPYFASEKSALKLISLFLSRGREQKRLSNIGHLKRFLTHDYLSYYSQVKLDHEAELQIILRSLCNKFVAIKKNEVLKDKVVIGLGGKFSAGKSKFINSYLFGGKDILPDAQSPTTAISSYIVAGDDETYAFTVNNQKVKLDRHSLNALTHKFYDKYKISFANYIDSIIISSNSLTYDKVAFLDTPGYSKADSLGYRNSGSDNDKAFDMLCGVDSLIWLFNLEGGELARTDLDFITRLEKKTPILFIGTRADRLTDEEITTVLDRVTQTVKNENLKVFGVTAYSSTENKEWNNNLIDEFLKMVSKQKTSNEDIIQEIMDIIENNEKEIQSKIKKALYNRGSLQNLIKACDNINDLRTVSLLHSEISRTINDLYTCKRNVKNGISYLEDLVKEIADEN